MQNAHIHDLTVTGTIYEGAIRIKNGGIVGIAYGNTRLTNCICNVTLNCIYISDSLLFAVGGHPQHTTLQDLRL